MVTLDPDCGAAECAARCINPTACGRTEEWQRQHVACWLYAAYLRRKSGSWPSFASAMQSPVLARLILQEAHHPAVQAVIQRPQVVRPDPPLAGVSSTVAKASNVTVTKVENARGSINPQAIDFKSLAAGERPDTDP